MNYAYNTAVGPNLYPNAVTVRAPVKMSSIENPSALVVFVDAMNYGISENPAHFSYWNGLYGVRYHSSASFNAVFADGHAKALAKNELVDSNWIP